MSLGTGAGFPGEHGFIASQRNARVEAWLASGGVVLTASERAARAVAAEFHAARRREGKRAWVTPAIHAWDRWLEEEWQARNRDGRMLLTPLQESALWTRAVEASRRGEEVLHTRQLSRMAQSAYRLLCAYAPASLPTAARRGWANDAAVYSEWLDAFDRLCREEEAVSPSRLALELTTLLRREAKPAKVAPLLLIGFDRLAPAQKQVLEAWGDWTSDISDFSGAAQYRVAHDAETEMQACIGWIRKRLEESSAVRLMVIAPNLAERRGELERALRAQSPNGAAIDFEFSLGVPLLRMSVARSAGMLLRWLHEPIAETELDWLLGSGHIAATSNEEAGLQSVILAMRRRDWGRPEWGINEFLSAAERWADRADAPSSVAAVNALRARADAAQTRLGTAPQRQSPAVWAAEARELLLTLGWPGFRPLGSVAYQSRERWEQALEDCGRLGFDNSKMTWAEFAGAVQDACKEAIFSAESETPRVIVTEPLESAGQLADGIWFLGADERGWPPQGQPHPLLPVGLQRDTGMPHASWNDDWELAKQVTARLLASAASVVFSYARQDGEVEARPSLVVRAAVGECVEIVPETFAAITHPDRTEQFDDAALLPFLKSDLPGGAQSLTLQSLCPFKAFGEVRLNAKENRLSNPALTPSQRGLLLHAVMRKVWGGRQAGGVSDLEGLLALRDLRDFVSGMVAAAMRDAFDAERANAFPDRYPQRYLKLESERLIRLVTEWLEYEQTRLPFVIAGTEQDKEVSLTGLNLRLRLDRVDTLPDGSRLIVDYKTGRVNPKDWDGERPEDVQLPLYASVAVTDKLEGLLFAQMVPGDMRFKGRVRDAKANLIPTLYGGSALVKNKLSSAELEDWRRRIEALASDFVEGAAQVDPKDVDKTCERCYLHAVCRIYENLPESSWEETDDGESESEESEDE